MCNINFAPYGETQITLGLTPDGEGYFEKKIHWSQKEPPKTKIDLFLVFQACNKVSDNSFVNLSVVKIYEKLLYFQILGNIS